MCGIFGIYLQAPLEDRNALAGRALQCLRLRGPDSSGVWSDDETGLTLGHTRLAILDLSPAGHQPMISRSGRYIVSYNGEVYNFREIAAELTSLGAIFQGGSDTEVLLAAFDAWGVEASLKRFNGMFAIALWDRSERNLYLCRDRVGIKPLYYAWSSKGFYFSSDPGAIRSVVDESFEIMPESLALYMRHNYVPMPHTIYKGMYKLVPGTYLTLSEDDLMSRPASFSAFPGEDALSPARYWSVHEGSRERSDLSMTELLDECDFLLRSSIEYRMIADVPFGAFLSGGVDSSLVVAYMQQQSKNPVKTFSIGFHEEGFNEAAYAKQVAGHLGTDHTELYVTAQDALEVVPLLPEMFHEPFADSSQIPTYLISKLTRENVTVSLSGDGGDELFCGYARYDWANRIWNTLKFCPQPLRKALSAGITSVSPSVWDKLLKPLMWFLPQSMQSFHDRGEKLHRLAYTLLSLSVGELYTRVNTHWNGYNGEPVLNADVVPNYINNYWPEAAHHPIQLFSEIDMLSYLPDDILTKVDRTSMFCSLEARVPLLDHRFVEFALSLPVAQKVHGGVLKYPLKELLARHLPADLINRPKKGFSVPVGQWIRGPLLEWAEDLLSETSLNSHGFFNTPYIRKHWTAHRDGQRNYQYLLWDILSFQSWYRANINS